MSKTILIIDDEKDLTELLEYNLKKENYKVICAKDGEMGLRMAQAMLPDLIVLDIMMPGLDGLEVCKNLRKNPKTTGVLVLILTAKAEEMDKVIGLEMGADDYMVKPFGVRELLARVKALLRRKSYAADHQEIMVIGNLRIDTGQRRVFAGDIEYQLTSTEFDILRALTSRKGRVMTREDLIDEARGRDMVVVDRTIDVHIAALRKKLGENGSVVETVRGVGYRIKGMR